MYFHVLSCNLIGQSLIVLFHLRDITDLPLFFLFQILHATQYNITTWIIMWHLRSHDLIFRQIVTCFLTFSYELSSITQMVLAEFSVVSRCVFGHVIIFRGSYFRNFVKLVFWVTLANSFFRLTKVVRNCVSKQFKIRPIKFWNFRTWKILTLLLFHCWNVRWTKRDWFGRAWRYVLRLFWKFLEFKIVIF